MDKKPNWWQRRKIGMSQGAPLAPWRTLNDGKPVQSLVIRYKDIYLDVKLDGETDLPTGDFGWSRSPHMFPDVNINEFWRAVPPEEAQG